MLKHLKKEMLSQTDLLLYQNQNSWLLKFPSSSSSAKFTQIYENRIKNKPNTRKFIAQHKKHKNTNTLFYIGHNKINNYEKIKTKKNIHKERKKDNLSVTTLSPSKQYLQMKPT